MCLSAYDLVCDECRRKQEEIYGDKLPETTEESNELWEKWLKSLCSECKNMMTEEGFITRKPTKKWKIKVLNTKDEWYYEYFSTQKKAEEFKELHGLYPDTPIEEVRSK